MNKKIWIMILMFMVTFSSGVTVASTGGDYAGSGAFAFVDGAVKDSAFRFPQGMLAGQQDALYVMDTYNNVIRYVKPDTVATLNAFSKEIDSSGFPFGGRGDGNLKMAQFNRPKDITMDGKGNLYVTDSRNNCIRKITGQKVYTFAGKGKAGYLDGLAQFALFNNPAGIAVDDQNNVYVADSFNHVIRKITPKGEVSTFAGVGPTKPGHLDGVALKAQFNEPQDVVFDLSEHALYVADTGNGLIRKIKDGKVSTYAGRFTGLDPATQYAVQGYKDGFLKSAEFYFPKSMALGSEGSLLVADLGNGCIRIIKGNRVDTLDTAAMGILKQPAGILVNKEKLYVTDQGDNKIKAMALNLVNYGTKVPAFILNGQRIEFAQSKPYVDPSGPRLPLKEVVSALKGKMLADPAANVFKVVVGTNTWVITAQEGLAIEGGTAYVDGVKTGHKLGFKANFDVTGNKVTWTH